MLTDLAQQWYDEFVAGHAEAFEKTCEVAPAPDSPEFKLGLLIGTVNQKGRSAAMLRAVLAHLTRKPVSLKD